MNNSWEKELHDLTLYSGDEKSVKELITSLLASERAKIREEEKRNVCKDCCDECRADKSTHPWGFWCHGKFHPKLTPDKTTEI